MQWHLFSGHGVYALHFKSALSSAADPVQARFPEKEPLRITGAEFYRFEDLSIIPNTVTALMGTMHFQRIHKLQSIHCLLCINMILISQARSTFQDRSFKANSTTVRHTRANLPILIHQMKEKIWISVIITSSENYVQMVKPIQRRWNLKTCLCVDIFMQ